MNPTIRIAVAEDNPKSYYWLAQKLAGVPDIEIVFHGINGKVVVEYCNQTTALPDLILMDLEMPVMNGIEATRFIKNQYPQLKIMALTTFDHDEAVFDMIQAGATGYLLKDISQEELIQHIRLLSQGGAPMSPAIALKIIEHIQKTATKTHSENALTSTLTKREKEILTYIKDGRKNREIADMLFISPLTVRKHVENIYSKLHVSNRVEAINILNGK